MIKFKIFTDPINGDDIYTADELLNDWLVKNPKVEIISFQYQLGRYRYNSICIMYKENK